MADLTHSELTQLRAQLAYKSPVPDWPECAECHDGMAFEPGDEHTAFCHDCAQRFIAETVPRLLDMAERSVSIETVRKLAVFLADPDGGDQADWDAFAEAAESDLQWASERLASKETKA